MGLSDEQRAALWKLSGDPRRGLSVVSARPGTGKTTTVAEYCIDVSDRWSKHHANWQGIAVLSYTNVARVELERKVASSGRGRSLLAAQNFIGTIDSFVNRFLFLPHGAMEMGFSGGRPKLVGEPYGAWRVSDAVKEGLPAGSSSPTFFDCYSFGAKGLPIVVDKAPRQISFGRTQSAAAPTQGNMNNIIKMKRHVWSFGLATQSDSNYLALATLVESPLLTQAIVSRFPVMVIDEAQDMTEVQHELLTHLTNAGLDHVVLVGDEFQAIYEWNTARPELFVARCDPQSGWRPARLSETFRCSPAICSALANLAQSGGALKVATNGRNRDYPSNVEIRGWDIAGFNVVSQSIDELAAELDQDRPHDANSDCSTIAVVARAGDTVASLQCSYTGVSSVVPSAAPSWNDPNTKGFLRIVHHLLANDFHSAVAAYESMLCNKQGLDVRADMRLAMAARLGTESRKLLDYRSALLYDLADIKSILAEVRGLTISDCAMVTEMELRLLDEDARRSIRADCLSFRNSSKFGQNRPIATLFAAPLERSYVQHPGYPKIQLVFATVHSVKGETYDGVVYFTKDSSSACGCKSGSARSWIKILQHNIVECEQKRIVYVALSRAARGLHLVVPSVAVDAWREKLGIICDAD
jgi:hypothetical protein